MKQLFTPPVLFDLAGRVLEPDDVLSVPPTNTCGNGGGDENTCQGGGGTKNSCSGGSN